MTLSGSQMRALFALLVCSASVIWLAAPTGKPVPVLTAVAFSPDGRFLAAGERHGRVAVWRAGSWQPVADFEHAGGGLNTLAFSPDSTLLAVAGNSLRLWHTREWKSDAALGKPGGVYGTARFSPDGQLVATVNAAERIELWTAATGSLVRSLCCMALYGDLAFSPDGRSLAAAGHWPRLWDVATGRELRRLIQTREPTFAAVAFRPDGSLLATGSQDGKARLWDLATGLEVAHSRTRGGYVETIAFHPAGTTLAYGVRNGGAWLWEPAAGTERSMSADITTNVGFSSDGSRVAFGTPGGLIRIWSLPRARPAAVLAFPPPTSRRLP